MVGLLWSRCDPTTSGEDWGWVNVGEVGQFQDGTWYVTVRAGWGASHQDRNHPDDRQNVPDYLR